MKRIYHLLQSKNPVKWLFYGDSITHGAFSTVGWRDYTELFSERVRWELRRLDDVIINVASSGFSTRDLMERFDWRVKQFNPHVVFIMIGMNDCCTGERGPNVPLDEFSANLISLVKRIRAMGLVLPVLQTTCFLLPGSSPDRAPYVDGYMAVVRKVARHMKLPLIDHAAYWKKKTATQRHHWFAWMSDPVHPNEMGHRVFAELLFKRLGIFDQQSYTCRLFHP